VNLRNRFKRADIKNYNWFIGDVSNPHLLPPKKYNLIICDAPCTGSGTWGRTPEQLYFFKEDKIDYYTTLQKSIVKNVSQSLSKDGMLLYITCSVFKNENEEVVNFLQKECALKLESMDYIKGFQKSSDTLFSALLTRL
jgi:16S rRNA (cytosine967-C5)-methyltransferase